MELSTSKKVLNDAEGIRVALIATYPEMSRILRELVDGTGITLLDIYASFEQAVDKAQQVENAVDVILTRGGTGHFIKESVSIPVVSIPIAPFDLLLSVAALPPGCKRIAFANYQRAIFGAEQIGALYGKEIMQYQFLNKKDLNQIASQAQRDGCDIFCGGAEGVSYARALGMEAVEVSSGREAVYQALVEAIEIVRSNREEKKRSTRLKCAFDSLAEGICVADEMGKISVFNPAAGRMFDLNGQRTLGKNIHDTPVGCSAVNTFDHFEAKEDHLEKIRDITVNANHIPIYLDGTFIGTVSTFQDVSKIQRLEGQIRSRLSQKGFTAKYTFEDIQTQNPKMSVLKKVAALYAQTSSAILLEGESGTGKELFAHSIHNASPRSVGPFVTVNCAAIPEQLLESELFGYAPGAFTGALKEGKPGLFELAHNGTIFLDEIGEMPKYLQSRLLRILQEKEVMRVGDSKIISINCRIISATNKNLTELVSKNEFREDLYYRLGTFGIRIPPLRERLEDIPLLSAKFLSAFRDSTQMPTIQRMLDDQLENLKGYPWPGNIRELQSICARISLLQTLGGSQEIQQYVKNAICGSGSFPLAHDRVTLSIDATLTLKAMQEEAERQYIDAVLKKNGNNQSLTAKQLEIGRTTLWRRNGAKEERPQESSSAWGPT